VSVWPFAEGLRPLAMAPSRGRKQTARLLTALDAVEAGGRTDLSRAVEAFLARRPRPGLVVVISDFLDPQGFARPVDRLIAERHEPALFHVVDREELEPPLGGDLLLVDSERGHELSVTLDERTLRAYRARVAAFLAELEGYAKKRGLHYGRVTSGADFEDALLDFLRAA
jgi:hypothetical protein